MFYSAACHWRDNNGENTLHGARIVRNLIEEVERNAAWRHHLNSQEAACGKG
jgi:hypothetical protein